MNEIIIVDAFITNEINEKKLSNFIERIKITKLPILLVSNTIINKEILDKVDYYIYDSENRLFEDIFEEYERFILWEILNNIKFNTLHKHSQKHALSVMVNLFNSILFAKNIGYDNFHRIEYDTILGDNTIEFIKNISKKTNEKNKKGYFLLNEKNKTQKFQYFYSNIDNFLEIIPMIKNQNDYIELLVKIYGSKKFVIIERVMYDLLKHNDDLILTFNDGEEVNDSTWNTESSVVHIEDKYKNCRTSIYHGELENIVLSKNNKEYHTRRKIKLMNAGGEVGVIIHELKFLNEYVFSYIDKKIDKIIVIENDLVIDTIIVENEKKSYEKNHYEKINF